MPTTPMLGRSKAFVYVKAHTGTPTAFAGGDKATGINQIRLTVNKQEIEADAYDYSAVVKLAGATDVQLAINQYFDPNDTHLRRIFDAFANNTTVDVLVVNGTEPNAGVKNFYVVGTYNVTQAPFFEGGPQDPANSPITLSIADGTSLTISKDLTSISSVSL